MLSVLPVKYEEGTLCQLVKKEVLSNNLLLFGACMLEAKLSWSCWKKEVNIPLTDYKIVFPHGPVVDFLFLLRNYRFTFFLSSKINYNCTGNSSQSMEQRTKYEFTCVHKLSSFSSTMPFVQRPASTKEQISP